MKTAVALALRWQRLGCAKSAKNKLTADRSTTELRWIAFADAGHTLALPFLQGKRRIRTRKKLLAQHSLLKNLVAGAGFEPAIPPPRRDYEPEERRSPVM